jgi:hypothetical protein
MQFRQAVYLNWAKSMCITEPCGPKQQGYKRIIACFIKNLMLDHNSRSKTVQGYVESINTLFQLQEFPILADLSDRANTCTVIISGQEKEENAVRQRSHITRELFAELLQHGAKSATDSLEAVVTNWFTFIRVTRLWLAEYVQKTESKVNVHNYPSGKKVIKAFLPTDWIFYDENGRVIRDHPSGKACPSPKKTKITFQIQKNRQNGQSIKLISDNNHPDICSVRAAYKIFLQSKRLGQTDKQPMAVFVNKNGKTKYLTGNKFSDVLCTFARKVHPDLSEDEIKKFSSHSGRVWALVLLDEARMSPDFCKSCLRRMGKSYRLYLRDTSIHQ